MKTTHYRLVGNVSHDTLTSMFIHLSHTLIFIYKHSSPLIYSVNNTPPYVHITGAHTHKLHNLIYYLHVRCKPRVYLRDDAEILLYLMWLIKTKRRRLSHLTKVNSCHVLHLSLLNSYKLRVKLLRESGVWREKISAHFFY